jgi:hypothetical protein
MTPEMREPSPSAIENLSKRYLNHEVLLIAVKKACAPPSRSEFETADI